MARAQGFLEAADDVGLLDESGVLRDSAVTLYVHVGIAAADVICCARLGEYSTGDNHAEAIALLKSASGSTSKRRASLLQIKTKAGDSHTPATAGEVQKASRAASQLVEEARLLG
ncbi:MAG: hypothetical protein ACRDP4_04270 [Nocardioidaceae bacterium]